MPDTKGASQSFQVEQVQHAFDAEKSDALQLEWTEEDESRIRMKMDWRIVPTVWILYLLCFIDRASIGNARVQGLEPDLNMVGGFRFNWALTIFYISYIAVEIPSTILLRVIGAKYYLPLLVVSFGLVSMCTSFVTNYAGIVACRFFLGIAEGGMMPGIAFYLSCFYRRQELMFRIGLFISGASLAGAFGGLLAAGLSSIPKWGVASSPLYGWRQIFFFEGIITFLLAGLAILVLPSRPDECKFLTPQDRYIALERINREHRENAQTKTTLNDVKVGLCNINNIICAFGFLFATISAQSLSLFLPTILRALGWTALKTQFYSVPPYAVACLWTLLGCWLSDRFKRRGLFAVLNAAISMTGYCIIVTASSNTIRYLGVFFAAAGAFPNGPGFLSWGLNNAAGPAIRAVTSGYIVAVGNVGSIIATWTYLPTDAPAYSRGHYVNVAAEVMALLLAILGIIYTKWENRKRDSGARDHRLVGLTEEQAGNLGYKHPGFRYMS
ncbi:hypothetical protein IFR05_010679 [Cadophora sp. M221]|nr:hypothetical protein IFR05_010679 [Cadophora sp. M221]